MSDLTPSASSRATAQVGETLLVVSPPSKYRSDTQREHRLATVTKRGRKWLTCQLGWRETRFSIESGVEGVQFSPDKAFGVEDWAVHQRAVWAREVMSRYGITTTHQRRWSEADLVLLADWLTDTFPERAS